MKNYNLKESLIQMDKDTDFKYTLTDLYEACQLDEQKKAKLAQYIDAKDPVGMNAMLCNEAGVMVENFGDDDLTEATIPSDWISYNGGWIYPTWDGEWEGNLDGLHYAGVTKEEVMAKIDNAVKGGYTVDKKLKPMLNAKGLFDEDWSPDLTDCPECGDIAFDSKKGRCRKCFYRESLEEDYCDEDCLSDAIDDVMHYGKFLYASWTDNHLVKRVAEGTYDVIHKVNGGTVRVKFDMSNPADSTLKMEINGKKFHTKNFREAQDFIIAELEKKNWKQFDIDLDEAFKAGDVVYVKPSKKTGRVVSVKGDYIEVEINGGKDPDRRDTFYPSDLEKQATLNEAEEVEDELDFSIYNLTDDQIEKVKYIRQHLDTIEGYKAYYELEKEITDEGGCMDIFYDLSADFAWDNRFSVAITKLALADNRPDLADPEYLPGGAYAEYMNDPKYADVLLEDMSKPDLEATLRAAAEKKLADMGYDEAFTYDYFGIKLTDTDDNRIKVTVWGELSYEESSELADVLNHIVAEEDPDAYFDHETSGRMAAYIRKDQSEDIPDEALVSEWSEKFNGCKTWEQLKDVYGEFYNIRDDLNNGTHRALYDIIDKKIDELKPVEEALTEALDSDIPSPYNKYYEIGINREDIPEEDIPDAFDNYRDMNLLAIVYAKEQYEDALGDNCLDYCYLVEDDQGKMIVTTAGPRVYAVELEEIERCIGDNIEEDLTEAVDKDVAIDWYNDSGVADDEAIEYCPEDPDMWTVADPRFVKRAIEWYMNSPYYEEDDEQNVSDDEKPEAEHTTTESEFQSQYGKIAKQGKDTIISVDVSKYIGGSRRTLRITITPNKENVYDVVLQEITMQIPLIGKDYWYVYSYYLEPSTKSKINTILRRIDKQFSADKVYFRINEILRGVTIVNSDSKKVFYDDAPNLDEVGLKESLTEDAEQAPAAIYSMLDAADKYVDNDEYPEGASEEEIIEIAKNNPNCMKVTKWVDGQTGPDEVVWERPVDTWYVSKYEGGAEYEPAEGGYYYETLTLVDSETFDSKQAAQKRLHELTLEAEKEGEDVVAANNDFFRIKTGRYIGDCEEYYVEAKEGAHFSGKQVYEGLNESILREMNSPEEKPYSAAEIEKEIKSLTQNFTRKKDNLKCGFKEENDAAVKLLKKHYGKVVSEKRGQWFEITFSEPKKELKEDVQNTPVKLASEYFYDNIKNVQDAGWSDVLSFAEDSGWINGSNIIIPAGTVMTLVDQNRYFDVYWVKTAAGDEFIPFNKDFTAETPLPFESTEGLNNYRVTFYMDSLDDNVMSGPSTTKMIRASSEEEAKKKLMDSSTDKYYIPTVTKVELVESVETSKEWEHKDKDGKIGRIRQSDGKGDRKPLTRDQAKEIAKFRGHEDDELYPIHEDTETDLELVHDGLHQNIEFLSEEKLISLCKHLVQGAHPADLDTVMYEIVTEYNWDDLDDAERAQGGWKTWLLDALDQGLANSKYGCKKEVCQIILRLLYFLGEEEQFTFFREFGLMEAVEMPQLKEASKSNLGVLRSIAAESGLILDRLTRSDLDEFDIYPYNNFTRPMYFVIDTGNSEQVVFAFENATGRVFVEEDTDRIGISTIFQNIEDFIKEYKSKIYGGGIAEAVEMTADEMKDKYGTDNPDIINAGKPEEERVALKEGMFEAEVPCEPLETEEAIKAKEALDNFDDSEFYYFVKHVKQLNAYLDMTPRSVIDKNQARFSRLVRDCDTYLRDMNRLKDYIEANDLKSRIEEFHHIHMDESLTEAMTYTDTNGFLGEPGETYTMSQFRRMWQDKDNDPVMSGYDSFEEWVGETISQMDAHEEEPEVAPSGRGMASCKIWKDINGVMGTPGEDYTLNDLADYWTNNNGSDPVLAEYKGDWKAWLDATIPQMEERIDDSLYCEGLESKTFTDKEEAKKFAKDNKGAITSVVDDKLNWTHHVHYKGKKEPMHEDYDEDDEDAEYIDIEYIKQVANKYNYVGNIDDEVAELGDDPDTLERMYSDITDVGMVVNQKKLGNWRFLLLSETDFDEPVIETDNGYYVVCSRGSIALVPIEKEEIFGLDESLQESSEGHRTFADMLNDPETKRANAEFHAKMAAKHSAEDALAKEAKNWPDDKELTYEEALALAKAYYAQGGDSFYETTEKYQFDDEVKMFGPMTVGQMKRDFRVFDSVANDRMNEGANLNESVEKYELLIEPYERYTQCPLVKKTFNTNSLAKVLEHIANRWMYGFDPIERAADEGWECETREEAIEALQKEYDKPYTQILIDELVASNGDGCGFIYYLKNLTTGDFIIDSGIEPEDEEEDLFESTSEETSDDYTLSIWNDDELVKDNVWSVSDALEFIHDNGGNIIKVTDHEGERIIWKDGKAVGGGFIGKDIDEYGVTSYFDDGEDVPTHKGPEPFNAWEWMYGKKLSDEEE